MFLCLYGMHFGKIREEVDGSIVRVEHAAKKDGYHRHRRRMEPRDLSCEAERVRNKDSCVGPRRRRFEIDGGGNRTADVISVPDCAQGTDGGRQNIARGEEFLRSSILGDAQS